MEKPEIIIREVETVKEMRDCIDLQRKVFASPDLEISPVRHLIVARYAGGFTLGAYLGERLVAFVLSLPMFLAESREQAFYSHMTAVETGLQSLGIGARLKWAQRERALAEGAREGILHRPGPHRRVWKLRGRPPRPASRHGWQGSGIRGRWAPS